MMLFLEEKFPRAALLLVIGSGQGRTFRIQAHCGSGCFTGKRMLAADIAGAHVPSIHCNSRRFAHKKRLRFGTTAAGIDEFWLPVPLQLACCILNQLDVFQYALTT
jgi:hypothetical protein